MANASKAATLDGDHEPARSRNRDSTGLVHRNLRHAILNGDIAAGTGLSQVRIAAQFGVSRGPVREALRLLEREGLIEARVNHRARVAAFSVSDLEGLYAMRIVTESLAINVSVPRFSADDLDELRRLLDELDSLSSDDTRNSWARSHGQFHRALVAHSGERLLRAIEQLHDHAARYRRFALAQDPRSWEPGRIEHREIVEACFAGDSRLAAVRLARHLSRTALTALMEAAPEHEPTIVRAAVRQVTAAGDATATPLR